MTKLSSPGANANLRAELGRLKKQACLSCDASEPPSGATSADASAFRVEYETKILEVIDRLGVFLWTNCNVWDLVNLSVKLRVFDAILRSKWIGTCSEVPNYVLTVDDSRVTTNTVGRLLRVVLYRAMNGSIDLRQPTYIGQISRLRSFIIRDLDERYPEQPEPVTEPSRNAYNRSTFYARQREGPVALLHGAFCAVAHPAGESTPAVTPAAACAVPGEGESDKMATAEDAEDGEETLGDVAFTKRPKLA